MSEIENMSFCLNENTTNNVNNITDHVQNPNFNNQQWQQQSNQFVGQQYQHS